jgi:hypothetical protein
MAITITGATFLGGSTFAQDVPDTLVLQLDAATYSGSGDWIDSVGSIPFTLVNSPSYSPSIGGGSFNFIPSSSQWAYSSASLSSLSTWTVEVWHYYAGGNNGSLPCLITETFVGGNINYTLGWPNGSPNFQAGFFNGGWQVTPTGYTLATGSWYQIVGTYNGSIIKLYVNNTLINSTSYSYTPASSGAGIRLMNRWDSADYWGGKLGLVKIYNADIGSTGVTTSWNTNKSRFGL